MFLVDGNKLTQLLSTSRRRPPDAASLRKGKGQSRLWSASENSPVPSTAFSGSSGRSCGFVLADFVLVEFVLADFAPLTPVASATDPASRLAACFAARLARKPRRRQA